MGKNHKTDRIEQERAKFRRFYLFGTATWILMVNLFYFGTRWTASPSIDEGTRTFANNMLAIILIFFVFGIPLIFLLSLGLRLAEKALDKIKEKRSRG